MMASSESRFTAPKMDWDQITRLLNTEFDLDFRKSDLIPGDSDKLIEIYSVLVHNLCDGLASIQQPRFKDIVQTNEDLDSTLTVLRLQSLLSSILKDIGCPGFSLADLIMPNGKRTQEFLTHILNFYLFSVEREDAGKKFMDKLQELHEKKQRLFADAPNVQRKLNDVAMEIYHAQHTNETLVKKRDELTQTLKPKMEVKTEVQKKTKALNADVTKVLQEKQMLEEILSKQREKLQKLKVQVVESPEHLEKKIEARKQSIARLKSDSMKNHTLLESKKGQIQCYCSLTEEVLILRNLLNSISEEMEFVTLTTGEIKTVEHTKQSVINKVKDVDETHVLLTEQLKTLSEEVAALEHQLQMQVNRSKLAIQDAQANREKLEKNAGENEKVRIGAYNEIEKNQEAIKNFKDAIDRIEQEAQSLVSSFIVLNTFHGILTAHLQRLQETIKRLKSLKMNKLLFSLSDACLCLDVKIVSNGNKMDEQHSMVVSCKMQNIHLTTE